MSPAAADPGDRPSPRDLIYWLIAPRRGRDRAAVDLGGAAAAKRCCFSIHDLRRTFASGLATLGIAQVIVEKLLNHISGGTLSPIAQVYNRYSYFEEQKEAIAAGEARLQTVLNS